MVHYTSSLHKISLTKILKSGILDINNYFWSYYSIFLYFMFITTYLIKKDNHVWFQGLEVYNGFKSMAITQRVLRNVYLELVHRDV